MLRTILLSALCVSATLAACNSPDLGQLGKCYGDFIGYYGFKFEGSLPAYWDFHEARGAVLTKGQLNIQPEVCKVANALVNCTAKVPNFDVSCLLSMGVNASDAQDYFTDRAVGGFQCGAGYNTLMKDFYCIGDVRSHKQAPLDKCTADMNNSIKNGGDVCSAENSWLMCQAGIYSSSCDYNAGVFMCGANRAGINANSLYCENLGKLLTCPPFQQMPF